MNFNHFNFRIGLYISLIVITSLAFAWSTQQEYMVATSSGLAVLIFIEAIALFSHLKKVKLDINRFIDAVKNQDSTLVFKKSASDPFLKEIHQGFNEIITDFRLVRKEKQLEHHFFQTTIQHIAIGLIAFNKEGVVRLQNKALHKLLDIQKITTINKLKEVQRNLPDLLFSLKHGEETFLKLLINNKVKNLSIKISRVKLENVPVKIVSFQDISREIDRNEVEAWQKLIKVLRHEMMNSISPIRIMSGNLLHLVDSSKDQLSDELIGDLTNGLQTIRKRSQGLSSFIESYRSISKIPQPTFTEVAIKPLINEVLTLFEKDIRQRKIQTYVSEEPENISIPGDENLIQQVLINLIKNAIEAFWEENVKRIGMYVYKTKNKTFLEIKDTGHGIPREQLDSIFIPFYTTKENGSGIGLSFSRQIMHLHNGSIQIYSGENEGTTVRLEF
jgi:nitrogen fixation/metabolism regulation signal transduction histidine kinase